MNRRWVVWLVIVFVALLVLTVALASCGSASG